MSKEELRELVKACSQPEQEPPSWASNPYLPPSNLGDITQRSIDVYFMSKQSNGEMGGIGWWQSANGYTAVALHDLYSNSKRNYEVLATALRECERRQPGLFNEFNDDTLWWGLCCLHVYEIGGDAWFLEKAKGVWRHVQDVRGVCRRGEAQFRGVDMEGAVYWKTDEDCEQINSISTGLFAELSVRLALVTKAALSKYRLFGSFFPNKDASVDEDVEIARCSLGWILRCRYRADDAIVLDNIMLKQEEARDWTFTYTTGVAIGVCALLYEVTREDEYLSLACTMADKAMKRSSWVEDNGVLAEHGAYGKGNHEPWQNSDAVGFKAVLMRHLATLYGVVRRTACVERQACETADLIKTFVIVNLQSQLERNTNGKGQYGPWWNGPFEMPTSHSQMAVLDVMAAAILVNTAADLDATVADVGMWAGTRSLLQRPVFGLQMDGARQKGCWRLGKYEDERLRNSRKELNATCAGSRLSRALKGCLWRGEP
ncbi:glycoside hydrolase family 76 protein [Zasmidium cellare ATCC 36951]|uniref:Glycoside hydrolase family 76 protein n=1 Tax=Zasmidium cellare ATCC 36951 TaxID=1080233 RepID=A0A6A6CLZ5_ZASCE|nr:glycoside hydrolase family 76 protein [Zasmidium cellare ATCC 36951]KAF2168214.1 glycoside hydrolase family 76 protein [Zasmidium cellare ATCC 36951]